VTDLPSRAHDNDRLRQIKAIAEEFLAGA